MFATSLALLLTVQAPQDPRHLVPVTVRGTALDGELKPVADVAIGCVEEPVEDVAAALAKPLAKSGANGAFTIAFGVRGDRAAWLVIGGGRHATQMRKLSIRTATELDLGAFALAPGHLAVGRVRGVDGTAIAGARVTATDLLDSREFLREQRAAQSQSCRSVATTASSGIFRLPGMVQSAGHLLVQKDGYYDEVLQPVAMGDPLDVTLTTARVLRGCVLDATGKGAASAGVTAGTATTRTDAEGRFVLQLRERGVTSLSASRTADKVRLVATKDLVEPDREIELRLQPAADTPQKSSVVRVVARTAAGDPVQAFTAYVSWNPGNQLKYRPDALLLARMAGGGEWVAAAQDGTATLRGAPSSHDDKAIVFVHAAGHAWGLVEADKDILDGEPVVVKLAREAVVTGRVLDAVTGAPIAGAQVIPTQRLTDSERAFYASGFRAVASFGGALSNSTTDADGRYELRSMPPGDNDVFVHVPGRFELPATRLTLAEGEVRSGVDLKLPPNLALRGVLTGPKPAGTQVRVHWHRPTMSSSAWSGEFEGAIGVAPDGAFTFPDLQPKPYMVQILLPAPPRGGQRIKLSAGIWDGAAPGAEPPEFPATEVVTVAGTVAGQVPWSRLGVAALWKIDDRRLDSQLALALVQPDRSFSMLVPTRTRHLLLFDPVTGVAFEWQEFVAGKAVRLAGRGEQVVLRLVQGDSESEQRAPCTIGYQHAEDHWPAGIGDFLAQGRAAQRSLVKTEANAGDTVVYWVPARDGLIRVKHREGEVELELGRLGVDHIDVPLSAPPDRREGR